MYCIGELWRASIASVLAPGLVVLLASGCSSVGDQGGTIEEGVGIARIESVSQSERGVRFEVSGLWPNACGRFSRFESTEEENIYRVQMFAEQPRGALCVTEHTRVAGTWETKVQEAGEYTFQFVSTMKTSLDTTLVFE